MAAQACLGERGGGRKGHPPPLKQPLRSKHVGKLINPAWAPWAQQEPVSRRMRTLLSSADPDAPRLWLSLRGPLGALGSNGLGQLGRRRCGDRKGSGVPAAPSCLLCRCFAEWTLANSTSLGVRPVLLLRSCAHVTGTEQTWARMTVGGGRMGGEGAHGVGGGDTGKQNGVFSREARHTKLDQHKIHSGLHSSQK